MTINATSNSKLGAHVQALTAVVTNSASTIAIAGNQEEESPPVAASLSAAAVAFETSPKVAAVKELVDYTTKHGASLYEQETKGLRAPFSMTFDQVFIFVKELTGRASMM